jgi:hypothetical protein
MILKIFSPKKSAENWRFWLKTKLNYSKTWAFFWEKRQICRRKLSKIAEKCDHNIGPWSRCSVVFIQHLIFKSVTASYTRLTAGFDLTTYNLQSVCQRQNH